MPEEAMVVANHLPEFAAGFLDAINHGLDAGLARVEEDARAAAPVATGALAASGYRITPITNDYQDAVSAMQSANGDAQPSEGTDLSQTTGEGLVGFAADYAIFVHDGHHTRDGSFVAGRPFLSQAEEMDAEYVAEQIAQAVNDLALALEVL